MEPSVTHGRSGDGVERCSRRSGEAEVASIGIGETPGTRLSGVDGARGKDVLCRSHATRPVDGAAWKVLSADGGHRSGSQTGGCSRNGGEAEHGWQRLRLESLRGVTGAVHLPGA
jgi:hypothetical protein